MSIKPICILSINIAFLLMACAAHADEKNADHFTSRCDFWGAPPSLARAIADVESGFRPWAINIQGESHYLADKESALALVKKASLQKKSYDIGLMQINSYWLKRLDLDPEDVLDPQINVLIGCWILAEEVKRYGLTWKAIGAYHTPVEKNPARARSYADKVLKAWEDYK